MTGPDAPYDGLERTSVLAAPVRAALGEALDALVDLDPVPGLAPLVRWAAAGEGVSLVHRLPLGARSLAEVRAEGPLRLGAAAAIGRSLVGPLRAVHDAGLAHGAVNADTVVLVEDAPSPGRGPGVVGHEAHARSAPGAVLAGTGAGWVIAPGAVGGPDAAGDVAALAELVRHLVGATPLPSGLVLVLLRCADEDPALRPTLDDLDRALAACLLFLDEDGTAPRGRRDPGVRSAPSAAISPGSVLDGPHVLRPDGRRPRRGRAVPRGRRRLALLGAAIVSALVLGRAVVAPALADVSTSPERLIPGAAPAGSPGRAATAAPTPEGAARSLAPAVASVGPAGDPAAAPDESQTAASPVASASAGARTPARSDPTSPVRASEAEPSPRGPSTPASGSAADAPVATDWAEVLSRLDGVRHAALVAGSREALARAVDPDGPAWPADAALVDRVRSLGARLVGGEVAVLSADLVSLDAARARLSVVDTRAAYAVTLDGTTARVPVRGVTTWDVRLVRAPDGTWRIHDVRVPT